MYVLPPPMIYSTTERVVGKWVDGKPIYQKTYTGTTGTTSGSGTQTMIKVDINASSLNIDSIIDMNFWVRWLDGSTGGWMNGLSSAQESYSWAVFESNKHIIAQAIGNYVSIFINKNYCLTIQYTKTTD